jgi:hypothetical protein
MKRLRLPLVHPLAEVFFTAIQSVTTSMSDSSKSCACQVLQNIFLGHDGQILKR